MIENSSHILRKVIFQSRSNPGNTTLRMKSFTWVGQLSCIHPTEIVKKLTSYEPYNFITSRLSCLDLVLCKLNSLGDIQSMKVDLPSFLTILGQKEVQDNRWKIFGN